MKKIITVILLAFLNTTNASAAQTVSCNQEGTQNVVLILSNIINVNTNAHQFKMSVNQKIVTKYTEVSDRFVKFENNNQADILSSWDGENTEINIHFPKGFLKSVAGTTSKGMITIEYNDIAEETISTKLDCVILN